MSETKISNDKLRFLIYLICMNASVLLLVKCTQTDVKFANRIINIDVLERIIGLFVFSFNNKNVYFGADFKRWFRFVFEIFIFSFNKFEVKLKKISICSCIDVRCSKVRQNNQHIRKSYSENQLQKRNININDVILNTQASHRFRKKREGIKRKTYIVCGHIVYILLFFLFCCVSA